MLKWLFIFCYFGCMGATMSVYAQGGEKAPAAIAGKYVIDNTVAVPAGAYTTFSTVYDGKRYYLGIDTTRAKAIPAKDTVAWYDQPNYASMWVVGGLYNPRATSETDVLPDKNYQRAIESLWIRERCSRKKYLALGDAPTGVTYNTLILRDSSTATPNGNVAIWYTQKDNREQNKYIQGFLYYYSDASGVDFYRYLTFNPLYGFSRAYAARPEASQRVSVWDRKTGNDVTCTMTPPTYTFDLNTTQDTLPLHITSHVYYYTNGDRFRSRYDQTDIYVRQPTVYDDQYGLTKEPYDMFGFYEWASNPRPTLPTTPEELIGQTYNGHSLMPIYAQTGESCIDPGDPETCSPVMEWVDSTVLMVSDTLYSLDRVENLFHDTLFAIGTSPFDVLRKPADGSAPEEGDYVPHSDWLRQHYYIKNPTTGVYEHFADSILIVRRTFHTSQNTTLNTNVNPGDHVFPYIYNGKDKDGAAIGTRNTRLFTVTVPYSVENDTLYANGVIARSSITDFLNLDIQHAKGQMIDGLWYDSLLIDYVYDAGTTTPCTWLTVDLNPARKDQIRVVAGDYNPEINANRMAEIHFTYRYSDGQVSSSRVIWITQRSKVNEEAGSSAVIYVFNHKDAGGNGLQNVHERLDDIYAIPEDNLNLPINRDHWGYYRWFIYGGDYNDKDLENNETWEYARKPKNYREADFMPINHTTDPASRGQWDVIRDIHSGNDLFEPAATKEHFVVGSATSKPALKYPSATATTKSGKVACEVSAYYDIATSSLEGTPYVGKNLTSLTEPTLSYRQVFNIQPAKLSADKMKNYLYRGDGDGRNNNWMEVHQVIVPAGRAFSLMQNYPVRKGDASIDDANLSYVYYLNSSAAKEGTDDGFVAEDYTKSRRYNRIGIRKDIDDVYKLQLLTPAQLNALGRNQSYDSLLLINPNTQTGRLIGDNGNVIPAYRSMTGFSTEKELRDTLEARLNRGEIGSAYLLTFEHYYYDGWFSDEDYLRFTHNNKEWKNLYTLIGGGLSYHSLKWYDGGTGSAELTIAPYSGVDTYLPTGIPANTLMTIYTGYSYNRGYFKAENKEIRSNWYPVYPDNNTPSARHAWLVYKVTKESGSTHKETPRWEVSANGVSGWTEVASESSYTGDYRMLPTGELHVPDNIFKADNETLFYRLRTEHFQLAKFAVVSRIGDGPATTAIITEDSIQNHFDIMYSMGNELFPAPGTSEMKAYRQNLPWSYSEFSYHYPRSAIGDEYRVFRTDLPAEGEYAFLNKFSLNGHTTNAMAGAENGYMLCIHAARKPLSIFNFIYSQLPCSDQQIYLTFNLANPLPGTGYNPQITAELQGKIGEGEWTPLHRFKTSELEFKGDDVWQQFVLEIPRASILGQDSFRCVATLNGSSVDNAYVLVDRLRFIAKERPMTVFQNKVTCLDKETEGDVYLTARLDYKSMPEMSGRLVAFQYQKKVGDSFVPLKTEAEVTPPAKADIDAYVNDVSLTPPLTDINGKSCGVIRVPAPAHVPCNGATPCDSIVDASNVTSRKKCYVNEGNDALNSHYVMFLSQRVFAHVGDTFRVVMAIIPDAETHPNFTTVDCTSERIIPIDNPIEIHVSGFDGVWPNYRRDELNGSDAAHTLRTANATYNVTATINDAFLPSGALAGSGKCMFDVVRTAENDRGMTDDTWFKNRFGVTRQRFREIMTLFRKDDPNNKMSLETNWNNVRPEYFTYDGRPQAQADSIYRILNHLIVDLGYLEIGVSSYDIYLADNNNSYSVFWPIPASGTYVEAASSETRSISVCSTPRWFEIHSDASVYSLRFGYDNLQDGNYYMTPVIRATATEANSGLKVRIADITHAEHAGVVIGWDSTYVIESNDPEWNPATKTFRYHQDRIVQERIFDEYYKAPSKESTIDNRYVTFTPVTSEYIAQLQATDCKCYNYDASKTTWDASGTGDDNVLIKQSDSGCNKWGVKYIAEGGATRTGTADHNMPGYQVANNITLKAGYWYKFKTSFFDVSSVVYYNEGGDGTCRGNSEFILAIAPDKVQWTPSHPDGINYWNDDNNWTPIMASAPADGFKAKVPMGETQVIIPELAAANTLPIVNNTVPRRIDTLDYGFKKNTCSDILFKPRSTILGQEMLDYERAFVDVPLATAEYMTFSPALKYIYAGDMYIPKVADNVDFDPKEFKDPSTSYSATYNRKTPYAMYAAYYNQTVNWAYYNTDTEGNDLSYKSRSSADWVFTNTMKMPLTPGTACLLLAYDKSGANADSLIVRLPKKETAYPYIGKKPDGSWGTGSVETMEGKPAFGDLSNNLAFNKTDLAEARTAAGSETAGMTYTLTNETPSKVFFFGNPTMALIDVYKLCQDNSSKLDKGGTGTSYYFTAYHLREGEASYSTRVITGPGQFFVAPQRSVGLIAASAGTELEVELRPEALVAMADGSAISIDTISFSAPARRAAYQEPSPINWLYMSAANETDGGLCKAYLTIGQSTEASRSYVAGEDALNLSSGTSNNVAYETPLSMYTIAGNEALMLDVRDSIGRIPLVFATLPDYEYEDYTLLSFAFEGNWSTPLYLYDALTNDSIQITNGLQVAVRTPESDQIRYFLNGNGARTSTDDDQPGITTDIEVVDDQSPITNNQSGTVIYDVLGRPVLKLSEHDLISNIQLPTGVYIIQRGKNTERMVIR